MKRTSFLNLYNYLWHLFDIGRGTHGQTEFRDYVNSLTAFDLLKTLADLDGMGAQEDQRQMVGTVIGYERDSAVARVRIRPNRDLPKPGDPLYTERPR